MTEMTPEIAVRVLRAKAAELEAAVAMSAEMHQGLRPIDELKADIALIAQLLSEHIARTEPLNAYPASTLTQAYQGDREA